MQDDEFVQMPCKKCNKPVDITVQKAEEYKSKNDAPLCLECGFKEYPERFE